jgi:hypothetical protein
MNAARSFLAALLATCAAAMASSAGAGPAALTLGPNLDDCRSALRLGPIQCAESIASDSPVGTASVAAWRPAAAHEDLEHRVDAFLSDYGKPPREAIRALLEPTDDHVRALLQKQQETIALASYLASRMTALRALEPRPAVVDFRSDPGNSTAVLGMRVTLFEHPQDPEAAQAQGALEAFAAAYPALRAGVALVGTFSARDLRREISLVRPPLAVATIRPDQCDAQALPFVLIEDARNGRAVQVPASDLTASDLRARILALRTLEPARPDAARPSMGATPGIGEGRVEAP